MPRVQGRPFSLNKNNLLAHVSGSSDVRQDSWFGDLLAKCSLKELSVFVFVLTHLNCQRNYSQGCRAVNNSNQIYKVLYKYPVRENSLPMLSRSHSEIHLDWPTSSPETTSLPKRMDYVDWVKPTKL